MRNATVLGLGVVVMLLTGISAEAQTKKGAASQELREEIARADARMFEAFNAHDHAALMSMFSERVEFYHDLGGLLFFESVSTGFKRMFEQNNGIRRELVKGTLEVYPVKDHGAIEIGEHRFCHVEDGKDDCGTFQFVQIWTKEGADWKVSRVISYGH